MKTEGKINTECKYCTLNLKTIVFTPDAILRNESSNFGLQQISNWSLVQNFGLSCAFK